MRDLPKFDDLPVDTDGRRHAWGLFGPDDSIGLINLQTPERTARAARLIKKGMVFSLNAPVNEVDPPLFGRTGYKHVVHRVANGFDDHIDGFHPQASSQWDSLGHIAFSPERYYNGASDRDVQLGLRNTVDHWSRRGLAGRAVLLDVAGILRARDPNYDPISTRSVTVPDLQRALDLADLEVGTGDTLLLHTGWLGSYRQLTVERRVSLSRSREAVSGAGLEHTEDMARFLWNLHVAAVACDGPTVEVWPPDDLPAAKFGFLHRTLIGGFGMALGELWSLTELAEACTRERVYEAFLTSAPLHIAGGIGAPANALAFL